MPKSGLRRRKNIENSNVGGKKCALAWKMNKENFLRLEKPLTWEKVWKEQKSLGIWKQRTPMPGLIAWQTARFQREMNMIFLAVMFISSFEEIPSPPVWYRKSRYSRPKEWCGQRSKHPLAGRPDEPVRKNQAFFSRSPFKHLGLYETLELWHNFVWGAAGSRNSKKDWD